MHKKLVLSVAVLFLLPLIAFCNEFEDRVKNVSVAISTPKGLGSGTLFVKDGNTYVLTCGHVAAGLRHEEMQKKDVNGEIKEVKVVTFEEAEIYYSEFNDDDQQVGRHTFKAKVLLYSAADEDGGLDLALMEVTKKDLVKVGARYTKDDRSLKVGAEVWHIGNLYGDIDGALVKGYVSRMDYKLKGNSFTVLGLGSRPGSSGGGVFVQNGNKFEFVGMVVRGDGSGLSLMKPSSVIRAWLKENNKECVLDGR